MKLNVLIVNTEIIEGDDLNKIIHIARFDYGCRRLPTHNHYLLCAVDEEHVDDILEDIGSLDISNPAYEITVRDINSQAELEALSLILQLEPR